MASSNSTEIFNRYAEALERLLPDSKWNLYSADSIDTPRQLFDALAWLDPSDDPAYRRPNGQNHKRYLDWVMHQATRGTLMYENSKETAMALKLFCSQPEPGNLWAYKTTDALVEAMLKEPRRQLDLYFDTGTYQQQDQFEIFSGYATRADCIDTALKTILKYDPSGGRNVPHLIRWMKHERDPLLREDFDRVREHLALHHKHKGDLPKEMRDLAKCESARQLASWIRRFDPTPSIDWYTRTELEDGVLAKGLAVEVARGTDFRLIHLTTQLGAQLIGEGTQWCTSWGLRDTWRCAYPTYQDGLLYLNSYKNDEIYQLHFGRWMHNDSQDMPIHSSRDFADFVGEHDGLLEALKPFALPHIRNGLGRAALDNDGVTQSDVLRFAKLDPALSAQACEALPLLAMQEAGRFPADHLFTLFEQHSQHPPFRAVLMEQVEPVLGAVLRQGQPTLLKQFLTLLHADADFRAPAQDWLRRQTYGVRYTPPHASPL